MRGTDIPLETVYHFGAKGKRWTTKRPKYTLKSTEEEKAHQEKLGKMCSYYYGTDCEKCCGVYPAFYTDNTFDCSCYYVCLVCGKESTHHEMPWQSSKAWNNHEYVFNPEKEEYQFTIFDYMKGEV